MLLKPSCSRRISGITHSFPWLFQTRGYVTYALLPRLPLSLDRFGRSRHSLVLARLACLIHAANVHSEPGSNPSWLLLMPQSQVVSLQPTKAKAFKPEHDSKAKKGLHLVWASGQLARGYSDVYHNHADSILNQGTNQIVKEQFEIGAKPVSI